MKLAAFFVLAFAAGALITVQTGSTVRLRETAGTLPAILVTSGLGLVALLAAAAVMGVAMPPLQRLASAPAAAWLGGLCGALYALTVVLLADRLGATTLTALVVTGQLICAVILDHFGVLGFAVQVATGGRILGCMLLLAGLALIWRSGQAEVRNLGRRERRWRLPCRVAR